MELQKKKRENDGIPACNRGWDFMGILEIIEPRFTFTDQRGEYYGRRTESELLQDKFKYSKISL